MCYYNTVFFCGQNPTYMTVYILWLKLVLVELLPYILIALLNTVIIL
jgi:hypothetical protein